MPPTLTRQSPTLASPSQGRTVAGWLAAGVAALAGAAAAGTVLEPPATVDVVVVNESSHDVTVDVRRQAADPLLPVASVEPGEERPVGAVVDQGPEWLVSFRVAGRPAGEVVVQRDDLAADGFRITVPATLEDPAAGVDPGASS